jgi:DNA-binding transcriptional regulator/RsmH inhibitor MraZ
VTYDGCGAFFSSVSRKGVIRLPAKFRLSSVHDEYFVTSLDGSSIRIYPLQIWVKIEERLRSTDLSCPHDAARQFLDRTNYWGEVARIENGGIQVSKLLLETANPGKRVFIIRLPDGYFEVHRLERLNDIVRRGEDNLLRAMLSLPVESKAEFVVGAMDACGSNEVNGAFSSIMTGCSKAVVSNPERLFQLSSRYFKHLVAEMLRTSGYDVELMARTREGGVDIFAVSRKRGSAPERCVVACKRWAHSRKVPAVLVRALDSVRAITGADRALFVTTSGFSSDAWKFVREGKRRDLELVDFDALQEWFADYRRR